MQPNMTSSRTEPTTKTTKHGHLHELNPASLVLHSLAILARGLLCNQSRPKWIEAKLLATITSQTIKRFFWQQIICRFGVPRELTIDNGTQFDCEAFKEFCMQIAKLCFASIRHPQSNGLVERANGIILHGMSRRLHDRPKGKWAEELTSVIWSHNTSESRATKFTPSNSSSEKKPFSQKSSVTNHQE